MILNCLKIYLLIEFLIILLEGNILLIDCLSVVILFMEFLMIECEMLL